MKINILYVIRLLRALEILSFITALSFIVTELNLTQMGKNSNKGLDQNQMQIGIVFVVIYFLCLLISLKSEDNIRFPVGENCIKNPMDFLRIASYTMAFIWYIIYIFIIVNQDREEYEKVKVVFLCRVMPVNCTYAFIVYSPLLMTLACVTVLVAIAVIIWIPILMFRCFKGSINVLKSIFNPKIIPIDTTNQMTDQSVTTV